MPARGLGIGDFTGVGFTVDERDRGGQMGIKAWPTATILVRLILFRGCALMCTQRVEALEDQSTIIAEEFMHPDHTQQYDRVIKIPLNPLTPTPRAAHTTILAVFADQPAIMSSMEEAKAKSGLDAVIEAYKKDVDVTLIRENLRLTVDQRFQQLMKLQEFAEELRRAGRKARSQS